MMTILKKLVFVAVLLIFSAGMVSAEPIRVSISAEPYPPFYTLDASGKWTGWEIDVIKAICEEAKLDYVLTPIAWDGLIPALMSKKTDVIMASMSITAKRMKSIDFSDKYYKTPGLIVASKKSNIDATSKGLSGKYLGVQTASIHQNYAEKYFKEAKIKNYTTQDEVNQDLISGRIDALQADAMAIQAFLDSAEGKCCEVKGTIMDDPEVLGSGIGAGIRKGDDVLKAKINAAISAIRANGKYNEITKKYFSFDIYGQ